eukprot:6188420-Pleurochrysis_carterae.AAC.1
MICAQQSDSCCHAFCSFQAAFTVRMYACTVRACVMDVRVRSRACACACVRLCLRPCSRARFVCHASVFLCIVGTEVE